MALARGGDIASDISSARVVRTPLRLSADRLPSQSAKKEMAWQCGFPGSVAVGTTLAIPFLKASFTHSRRTAMKFESLMLQSLFGACLLICVLVVGAMLTSPVTSVAASHAPVAATTVSAS
jgi:hypothetical protein